MQANVILNEPPPLSYAPESFSYRLMALFTVFSPQLKIITLGDQHHRQPVMVVHILSLGLTAFVLYLSAPGTDLFSWHPSLMTVAFALLLSQV